MNASLRLLAMMALSASWVVAQAAPKLTEETVYGRHAWVLSNGLMRVAVLSGGGHIAEVRLITGDPKRNVNPMRVPHYPTIEPQTYDDSKHNKLYGDDPHRRLHSGYMGHLMCFPFYGPVSSPQEAESGLGNHGEAPVVEWRKVQSKAEPGEVTLDVEADLVKTRYKVGRRFTLAAGAREVKVEEWVENLLPFDRPMQWMQHATFGQPFIDPGKSKLTLSTKGGEVERVMPAESKTGGYTPFRTDTAREEQFFRMSNPDYSVSIEYRFPSQGNPWIADWFENRRTEAIPWSGKAVVRGIEFGNSPYAEGLRKAIERGSMEGTPSYGWIGAKKRMATWFTIRLLDSEAR